jgi:hypothetical protein
MREATSDRTMCERWQATVAFLGQSGGRQPERRKVGGSTPPLTTPSTLRRSCLYAAGTHQTIALVAVPVRYISSRLVTAVARSLLHVGCTPSGLNLCQGAHVL